MTTSSYRLPLMTLFVLSLALALCTTMPPGRAYTTWAGAQEPERFPYYEGGKYGYVDKDGRVVIPPRFSWASEFSEGAAVVAVPDALNSQLLKFGYIDSRGEVKVKPQFDYASGFSAGRAVVGNYTPAAGGEMRFGYIDAGGQVIVAPKFLSASPFSEGLALVQDERKNFGYVDLSGRVAIEPQFYRAGRFSEGLALAADESGMYGYVNTEGKFRIRAQFTQGTAFSAGLAAVMIGGGKVGYIDKDGKFFIRAKFDAGRPFSEGFAAVREGDRWHYINREGARAFPQEFSQALNFSEGLAAVRVGEDWGYVGRTGGFAVEPQFAAANPFSGGRALVIDGTYLKRIYVGRDGKKIAALASAADVPPTPFPAPNAVIELAGAGFGNDTTSTQGPVEVRFVSTPEGATVYLVRLRVWEQNPNIINNSQLLAEHRFQGGSTPTKPQSVAQKTYMAIFERGGRRIPLRVEVMKNKDNTYVVDFTAP